jgi:multidrug efflux system membrane fusion protein
MSMSAASRRNSILIAAAIAIALVAWIASGLVTGVSGPEERVAAGEQAAMRVSIITSRAEKTARKITVSARTEPDRTIELKAETEGVVVAIGAERGALVTAGQHIVDLDMRDRRARLDEAEALLRQRQVEYEAAERLRGDQFISEADLAGVEASIVSARAMVERIELDIRHTAITAPFDAVVYDRLVEIGDYVGVGDPIAQLVDTDPLIVVGNINERDVRKLTVGGTGTASVLGGPVLTGTVRYLAPVADESTRSFRVELAIPNPDRDLRAGTSAELILGAEEITAHSLSAAVLSLADDGTIGVKTVDSSNRVHFVPVEIVSSTAQGMLVTGLAPVVRIISVGQGFVTEGQTVIPVEDSDALEDPAVSPRDGAFTELERPRNERAY